MSFSAIAIDDNIEDLTLITQHFQSFNQINLLETFTSVKSALDFLIREDLRVDILFCDQQMPDYEGFKVRELLHDRFRYFILVTHYDSYAMAGFEHAIDGYLLKPLREEYTLRLLRKLAQRPLGGEEDFVVYIKAEDNEHRALDMSQVPCILSDGNYCHIYTPKGEKSKWIISSSLKSMELQLAHLNLFIRTGKSSLVNKRHIRVINLEDKQLRVNGINLPIKIGDTYLEALADFHRSRRIFSKAVKKDGAKY